MPCDMFVAFGPATVQEHMLFGVNQYSTGRDDCVLKRLAGASHSPDEIVRIREHQLPQVRQTAAVLGLQLQGDWGLLQGCNEFQVVLGVATWRSRWTSQPGLAGTDLVRLALERCHSAGHAVEVLTDLIGRHGNVVANANASVFLVADAREAYVLEAAGTCWALLECQSARAVADVALIRQDWQRLSPCAAELAIQNGWWHDDGTKLDFAGSLGQSEPADAWALKRWGKATLSLAQKSGSLDPCGARRFLADHFEATVRVHPLAPKKTRHQVSLITRLDPAGAPISWIAVGSVEAPLYFPLVVDAEIPAAWFTSPPALPADSTVEDSATEALLQRLQHQFDQDAEEFAAEARLLKQQGELVALRRLGQTMMQKHLEQWETECGRQPSSPISRPEVADEELVPFAFG